MALAQAIAEHLPFLRRYARALCGSQKSGDAYVRAALEAIVADPGIVPSTLSARVGLYRVFHVIWSSSDLEAMQPATDLGVERKLQRMTPASRQALLLTAMEGFTRGETGRILGVSDDKTLELLASALQEIARQPLNLLDVGTKGVERADQRADADAHEALDGVAGVQDLFLDDA